MIAELQPTKFCKKQVIRNLNQYQHYQLQV